MKKVCLKFVRTLHSGAGRLIRHWLNVRRRDKWIYVGFFTTVLLGWLFVGVLHIIEENDSFDYPFLKRVPSFQVVFTNPYASDPIGIESGYMTRMDSNGDWLPGTRELKEYLAYCKARFGIDLPDPIEARTRCRPFSKDAN